MYAAKVQDLCSFILGMFYFNSSDKIESDIISRHRTDRHLQRSFLCQVTADEAGCVNKYAARNVGNFGELLFFQIKELRSTDHNLRRRDF